MTNNKIIGLGNTANIEYQKKIHDFATEILSDKDSINLTDLQKNEKFQSIFNNNDIDNEKLYSKIESIAGKKIDKRELKTVLILMDAFLNSENSFEMDLKFDLDKNSGIFQATKMEIAILKNTLLPFFNFDLFPRIFPQMKDNNLTFETETGETASHEDINKVLEQSLDSETKEKLIDFAKNKQKGLN